MADEAAQDIQALNLRDKDRDDSERRDEVRRRGARFPKALFFFFRGGAFRFFETAPVCHVGGSFRHDGSRASTRSDATRASRDRRARRAIRGRLSSLSIGRATVTID